MKTKLQTAAEIYKTENTAIEQQLLKLKKEYSQTRLSLEKQYSHLSEKALTQAGLPHKRSNIIALAKTLRQDNLKKNKGV